MQVSIKSPSLKVIQRQQQLAEPTFLMSELSSAALAIVLSNWPKGAPIRALTVTALDLIPASEAGGQMSVFDDQAELSQREKRERLEAAVSDIRRRYGKGALRYGADGMWRGDGEKS